MIFAKSLMIAAAAFLSGGTSPPDWNSGFCRSLLAIDDQDEDGIRELLIVDSSHTDGAPAKFHVWSPGADRCLQSFDHGLQLGEKPDSVVAVAGFEGADAAYVGLEFGAQGVLAYLVLFSTADGAELRRLRLDYTDYHWTRSALWNLGDVDGEPGDEVFVSYSPRKEDAEGEGWRREGVIVSLETGALLRVEHGDGFGVVSDVTGDGVREYIVRRDGDRGFYCGASGELLFTIDTKADGDPLISGFQYEGIGDLDGDGTRDIFESMWGETGEDEFYSETRLRSGVSGDLLWTSERVGCTGYPVVRSVQLDDHDKDETPDVLLSNAWGVYGGDGCPDWRVLSGSSGAVLARFEWFKQEPIVMGVVWVRGTSLALMDDIDGDGYRDVAISHTAPRHKRFGDGLVGLYSTKSGLVRTIRLADMLLAVEEK